MKFKLMNRRINHEALYSKRNRQSSERFREDYKTIRKEQADWLGSAGRQRRKNNVLPKKRRKVMRTIKDTKELVKKHDKDAKWYPLLAAEFIACIGIWCYMAAT